MGTVVDPAFKVHGSDILVCDGLHSCHAITIGKHRATHCVVVGRARGEILKIATACI